MKFINNFGWYRLPMAIAALLAVLVIANLSESGIGSVSAAPDPEAPGARLVAEQATECEAGNGEFCFERTAPRAFKLYNVAADEKWVMVPFYVHWGSSYTWWHWNGSKSIAITTTAPHPPHDDNITWHKRNDGKWRARKGSTTIVDYFDLNAFYNDDPTGMSFNLQNETKCEDSGNTPGNQASKYEHYSLDGASSSVGWPSEHQHTTTNTDGTKNYEVWDLHPLATYYFYRDLDADSDPSTLSNPSLNDFVECKGLAHVGNPPKNPHNFELITSGSTLDWTVDDVPHMMGLEGNKRYVYRAPRFVHIGPTQFHGYLRFGATVYVGKLQDRKITRTITVKEADESFGEATGWLHKYGTDDYGRDRLSFQVGGLEPHTTYLIGVESGQHPGPQLPNHPRSDIWLYDFKSRENGVAEKDYEIFPYPYRQEGYPSVATPHLDVPKSIYEIIPNENYVTVNVVDTSYRDKFVFKYRKIGDPEWSRLSNMNSEVLYDLDPGTEYEMETYIREKDGPLKGDPKYGQWQPYKYTHFGQDGFITAGAQESSHPEVHVAANPKPYTQNGYTAARQTQVMVKGLRMGDRVRIRESKDCDNIDMMWDAPITAMPGSSAVNPDTATKATPYTATADGDYSFLLFRKGTDHCKHQVEVMRGDDSGGYYLFDGVRAQSDWDKVITLWRNPHTAEVVITGLDKSDQTITYNFDGGPLTPEFTIDDNGRATHQLMKTFKSGGVSTAITVRKQSIQLIWDFQNPRYPSQSKIFQVLPRRWDKHGTGIPGNYYEYSDVLPWVGPHGNIAVSKSGITTMRDGTNVHGHRRLKVMVDDWDAALAGFKGRGPKMETPNIKTIDYEWRVRPSSDIHPKALFGVISNEDNGAFMLRTKVDENAHPVYFLCVYNYFTGIRYTFRDYEVDRQSAQCALATEGMPSVARFIR